MSYTHNPLSQSDDFKPDVPKSNQVSLVARQPIFDQDGKIQAYELLFRDTDGINACRPGMSATDSHAATSRVILEGFTLLRPSLLPGQRFFINFTEELLEAELPSILPPDVCVLEILETVTPSPWLMRSLENLKKSGYILALDDYNGQEQLEAFIPLADIIKIDVLLAGEKNIALLTRKLASCKAQLLAEKVENAHMSSLCKEQGFTLFQGFFYSRPEVVKGRKIATSEITQARLLALSYKDDIGIDSITKIIAADVSLTFKLLNYTNSVHFGLPSKVTTVQHAIMLLGRRKLTQWLYFTALATMNSTPLSRELAYISALRAKFLETLGKKHFSEAGDNTPELLFLTGLFSLLEAIMGMPVSEISAIVPMDGRVVAALQGQGPLGPWLKLAEAYEHGDWDVLRTLSGSLDILDQDLSDAYTIAAVWSSELYGE